MEVQTILKTILLVITLQLQPSPPEKPYEYSKEQLEMYNEYAEFRLNNGVLPQILNPKLCELAQQHSERQNKANKIYHSNLKMAENVARGGTPKGTIQMWIVSPGHKRNLLSKYRYVGFGYSGIYGTSLHSDLKKD